MSQLSIPQSLDDLPQPFRKIGQPGWVTNAHKVLEDYGVPIPQQISESQIETLCVRLGRVLPTSYHRFLLELGALDIDGWRFLPPQEVELLTSVWFRNMLKSEDQKRLEHMLGIGDYLGSGDHFALDLESGRCCLCGHDPAGFSNWLNSFDDLVRLAFMLLPVSYYGWPDESVQLLVHNAQQQIFGTNL